MTLSGHLALRARYPISYHARRVLGAGMKRRFFIAGAAALLAEPSILRAQKAPVRIGMLSAGSPTSAITAVQIATIKQGLRDNGLTDGRDYILEPRFSNGDHARFPELARDLAARGARVLLAGTITSVRAAQNVVPPIPIVMVGITDPVGTGLISSLAHPGGHTTGTATLNQDISSKLLDMQQKIVPNAKTIAVLFNPTNPSNPAYADKLQTAAVALGMKVVPFEFKSRDTLDSLVSAIGQQAETLHVGPDAAIWDLSDRIGALALSQRLPSFSSLPKYAVLGGLIEYGAFPYSRAGYFLKRVLDGANPGDLAVEQPTRFELAINIKTAKALNLTIPDSLLALADEVIE
jgi:putative ABC transport system substrate-binding protein